MTTWITGVVRKLLRNGRCEEDLEVAVSKTWWQTRYKQKVEVMLKKTVLAFQQNEKWWQSLRKNTEIGTSGFAFFYFSTKKVEVICLVFLRLCQRGFETTQSIYVTIRHIGLKQWEEMEFGRGWTRRNSRQEGSHMERAQFHILSTFSVLLSNCPILEISTLVTFDAGQSWLND